MNPRWIVSDGDYNIELDTGLMLDNNKTIDGRGRGVLIQAPDDDGDDLLGPQDL
jgi:hypothetical protein